MKELSANNMSEKKEKINRWTFSYKNHFLEPIKSGLFGFAIFITILIIVKLFSYLIGSYNYFAIEITDVQLSLIGFVLLFLIRFLENFKETE
ncbi:MAG: hypothetical protein COW71_02630 [Ignavibacteriales bacterium CG18_big_fil_WC_8_21_14_2_50_31_20]|nr:MAG: hypothetical protein COW71_02630 [Ignavibacteriales bacterium CG18_big_fil_WC_8_21_14_2_50_31_20]